MSFFVGDLPCTHVLSFGKIFCGNALYSLRYEHIYETQYILLKLIKHHKNRFFWLGCGMVEIALEKATVVNEKNIGYVVIYHVSRK